MSQATTLFKHATHRRHCHEHGQPVQLHEATPHSVSIPFDELYQGTTPQWARELVDHAMHVVERQEMQNVVISSPLPSSHQVRRLGLQGSVGG